jgi:deoxyhypusine synthase
MSALQIWLAVLIGRLAGQEREGGAVPNEKITWGKLGLDTPKYVIESDATIVAPLMLAKVLGL